MIFNLSIYDDLMDQKVLQENYNTTRDDAWQFVPSISRDEPHKFVICLIWSMPIDYQLSSDLTYEVICCCPVSNKQFAYYNTSKNLNFFINLHLFSA